MTDAPRPVGSPVDLSPAQPPGPVTLPGRYGRVARLDPARDSAGLWQFLRGRDEVWTYMSYGPFADERAFSGWLAERETLKDPYYYTALDSDGRALRPDDTDGNPPGHARRRGRSYRLQSRAPAHAARHRNSIPARALRIRDARQSAHEWKCDSLNARSRRAAARYGFVFEGILRQHMIAKGRNRDTAYFSILDSEWPARKRNFELWLRPENFDGGGRQRLSLAELNRQEA